MPIYQYRCQECGKVSEFLILSSTENKVLICQGCGGQNLEKLISAPILVRSGAATPGTTCCGREERCEAPPCSTGERCHRH